MTGKPVPFSEQLRAALENCGQTCYVVARETGLDKATLSRFLNRKGGLSMPALDALAAYLGWHLTTTDPNKSKKGKEKR